MSYKEFSNLSYKCQNCTCGKKKETTVDEKKPEYDEINYPKHYTQGKYQPIDISDDWDLCRYLFSVLKYIARYKHKGTGLKDLKKAQYYLNRKIKLLEKNTPPTS